MPPWIGTTIGKVKIEKQLAQGGMAEVYLGTHISLDRPVAIKVLHSFIEADEGMKARFQREARVVAALRHPNIVQIYDFDTVDYAHSQGVIHRDIKPGNIILHMKAGASRAMLTDQIEPVITDFGLVRILQATTRTASGLVSGTPAYISPEQAQGLRTDHRSDIYSLGVVLYEILAGRVPFEAETNWTVIYKHIHEPLPILNLPAAVQLILERALAKDPADRYQTCRDLAAEYRNAIGQISEAATLQLDPVPAPAQPDRAKPEPETPAPAPARRSRVP